MDPFAGCFYGVTTWMKAQSLLIGTILTPGRRRVSTALRVMGLSDSPDFAQYHQVLSRAVWSPLDLARRLLGLLVSRFCPGDIPLIFGLADTLERRWGAQIAARGIYRDPVRSSHSHLVKASGLRWISLMLLTPIPWAQRVWALPFMTVLSPTLLPAARADAQDAAGTQWTATQSAATLVANTPPGGRGGWRLRRVGFPGCR